MLTHSLTLYILSSPTPSSPTFSIHVLNSIYVEWFLLSALWYPQWFPFSTAFYQQELKDGHWGIKQDHLWPWLHSNLCADMTGQAMLICWVQLPCVCSLSSAGLILGPYLPFHTCPYSVCTLYSQLESHWGTSLKLGLLFLSKWEAATTYCMMLANTLAN